LWIINPNWLIDSVHRWKKQEEHLYVLELETPPTTQEPRSDIWFGRDDLEDLEKEIEGELDSVSSESDEEPVPKRRKVGSSPLKNVLNDDSGSEAFDLDEIAKDFEDDEWQ
jgi:hypothetical protein